MARAVGLHLPVFKFVNGELPSELPKFRVKFKLKVPGPRLPHRLAALALWVYIRDL